MNKQAGERMLQQIFGIWITPEIRKRKKRGRTKNDFNLFKAQIIFSVGSCEVRLNDEVKAIFTAKVNRRIDKGDSVFDKDIDEVCSVKLTNGDANSAHITLLAFKNKWAVFFDFIYNKKDIEKHIEASKEFYESAKENLQKNRLRPFFENAFASAELSAKSYLLSFPDKKILTGRNHKDRKDKYEEHNRLGNVKPDFSITLSKLSSLRDSARYLHSDDYKNEDVHNILRILKQMIDSYENRFQDYSEKFKTNVEN